MSCLFIHSSSYIVSIDNSTSYSTFWRSWFINSRSFLLWVGDVWFVCGTKSLVHSIVLRTGYEMDPHVLGCDHLAWQWTGTAPGYLERRGYPGSMSDLQTVISIFCLKFVQCQTDLFVGDEDKPCTAQVWRVTIWETRRAYFSCFANQYSSTVWG